MKDYIYKPKHLIKLNKKLDEINSKKTIFQKIKLFFLNKVKLR